MFSNIYKKLLLMNPWIIAHQAPLSMGFSRQEYCSGWPFSSPGDLPDPRIKPRSPALQTDSSPSEPPGNPNICVAAINMILKLDFFSFSVILLSLSIHRDRGHF